jgi:diguanylate cyclase (GGDEF)-like protein/PAS domain S-box-containing protein
VGYHWSSLGALMLLSGSSCAACAVYVARRRGAVGRFGLVTVLLGSAIWGLAYAVELGAATRSGQELWGALKYLGILLLPPAWLIFSLAYTGRERSVTQRVLAALSVEPAVMLIILAVPSTRHLIRSYPAESTSALTQIQLGPAFYVLLAYSALLAALGTGLLTLTLMRISAAYRTQSLLLLSAVALVWITNILATVGVGPFRVLDPTPPALAVAGLMLILGVFRFGLLDLVPVARTTLIETMPDPVLVLDAHGRVIDHNPAAESLLRVSKPALLGGRFEQLLGAELPVQGRENATRHELTLAAVGGEKIFEVAVSVLGDGRHDGPGHLVVFRDITGRKQAEARLAWLAHFDVVTGLPNRALFYDRLEQALAQARRRRGSFAVLFLDLDRFKLVNDSLGHDVGDKVLALVARRLASVLRSEDTIARFGGDEFGVLLPDIEHPRGPIAVAQKMQMALAEPLPVNGHVLVVNASIGIAVFPGDGTDRRSLINQSDAAMYKAKAHGGSRIYFASPRLARATVARLELESDLRAGLDRELFLDFQPVIDMASGATWGYEALVRWQHPRRGVIGPSNFVPLAEEIGLSPALDRWVLGEACRKVTEFDRQLPVRCYLSINVCPAQLKCPNLLPTIQAALASAGFDGTRLVVEVSERAVTDGGGRMSRVIQELRSLGVSVALDDFGAGSTSLGQLGELPLNFLKIDQRFVASLMPGDGAFLAIVEAVTTLAHTLGMSVIAEGVETELQRRLLLDAGCNLGQGFLLARPQPITVLAEAGQSARFES